MEDIMTRLTHEQQSLVGMVPIMGIPAHGTGFARVIRVYLNRHASCKLRFVGDIAMQFCKRPFGGVPIALALLDGNPLTPFAVFLAPVGAPFAPFADMGQVFQPDEAVWVRVHNAPTDEVVAILFQPSLSSTDDDQASSRGTSAFLLQPLSQSCIMISLGSDSLARI